MTTLSEGQVVAAYRQCRRCGKWKKRGNFGHRGVGRVRCSRCVQPVPRNGAVVMSRGWSLTAKGKRVARQLLAEDVA